MDEKEFRCKMCGGDLAIDDITLGIAKCLYCSNKTRLDPAMLNELRKIPQQKLTQDVMVNMTKEDVEAAKRARGRENAIYAIKGTIAILSLAILGVYAFIMYYSIIQALVLSNLELVIVSFVGIIAPAMFSVISKVDKKKIESLALHIILLIVSLFVSGIIVYFAFMRYLIVLI